MFRAEGGDIFFIYFLRISLASRRYFGKFLRSRIACWPMTSMSLIPLFDGEALLGLLPWRPDPRRPACPVSGHRGEAQFGRSCEGGGNETLFKMAV